jgi:hypothetical protein
LKDIVPLAGFFNDNFLWDGFTKKQFHIILTLQSEDGSEMVSQSLHFDKKCDLIQQVQSIGMNSPCRLSSRRTKDLY